MQKLQNYIYKEDLGGLCPTCSDYGYNLFATIDHKISYHNNLSIQEQLLHLSTQSKWHYERTFEEELIITEEGKTQHNDCINHCILHALGDCQQDHNKACYRCSILYELLQKLQKHNIFTEDEVETFKKKLLYWISHQVRKTYLSPQLNATLRSLDDSGAILLCDYKMKVLKKSTREKNLTF